MSLIYERRIEVLKKDTRVIDAYVVNFYIVKVRYKFFNFIQFTSNELINDINLNEVDEKDWYKIKMAVKAAEYTILSNNAELMIDHKND